MSEAFMAAVLGSWGIHGGWKADVQNRSPQAEHHVCRQSLGRSLGLWGILPSGHVFVGK